MTVKDLHKLLNDGKIISDIELQREIVYNTEKQELVIDSIINDIPLPAFYLWRNSNNILEVLDGKQRIEAIKRFFQNDIQYNGKLWKQIGVDLQEKISNTNLCIIECAGPDQLRREVFKRINTLGVPLSQYEVLNGLYHGEYLEGLSDFVGQDKNAISILGQNSRGKNQITIIRWILSLRGVKQIDEYVKENQNESFEKDQQLIIQYIKFIKDVFTDKSKIKLDIRFKLSVRYLYEKTRWKSYRDDLTKECNNYVKSDDYKITRTPFEDIEAIILGVVGNFRVDKKRFFTKEDRTNLLQKLKIEGDLYPCNMCNQHFYDDEITIDHVNPWSKGGRTVLSNAEILCRACNSSKGNK